MIPAAGQQQGAVWQHLGGDLMKAFDEGAGGIHDGIAPVLQGGGDLRRHPVGTDHHRHPGGGVLRPFDGRNALPGQLLHHLPVMDELPQRAGGGTGSALLGELQRPAHPEAEPGGFGDGHLHTGAPVFCRI